MYFDLTDEETASLIRELHDIVENDRYPFSPRHPHAAGDPRQAQTGAGAQTPTAARRSTRREPGDIGEDKTPTVDSL
jgi:hypothetical protein